MVSVGDIVTIDYVPQPIDGMIFRCPSMYGFSNIYFSPKAGQEYIICDGNSVSGFHLVEKEDHTVPLGFCLLYIDGLPYVRVTQVNHEPEPVRKVTIVGKTTDIPAKGFNIGSSVVFCEKIDYL